MMGNQGNRGIHNHSKFQIPFSAFFFLLIIHKHDSGVWQQKVICQPCIGYWAPCKPVAVGLVLGAHLVALGTQLVTQGGHPIIYKTTNNASIHVSEYVKPVESC